MVWARTKLLIYDYIFEPVKQIQISYIGKNPEKLYKKIAELIRIVFNVPDTYVQEKEYDWQKEKDIERFSIDWEAVKLLDLYSYLAFEVELKGFTSGGEGKAAIRIKPRLITEYPQDTIWQQNIIYEMMRRFWHRMFYHHKRMEFLNMGKEMVVNFESSLKHYMEMIKEG